MKLIFIHLRIAIALSKLLMSYDSQLNHKRQTMKIV